MASGNNIAKAYGIGGPFIAVFPAPIVTRRNPTVNDTAEIGQLWVNSATNASFVLAGSNGAGSVWTVNPAGGGAGVFTDLSATGVIDLDSGAIATPLNIQTTDGGSNITVQSAAAVSITAVGNATLTSDASATLSSSLAADNAVQLTTTDLAGGVEITAGTGGVVSATTGQAIWGSTRNAAGNSVFISANGNAGEVVLINSAQGTLNTSVTLSSTSGGITLSTATAAKQIILAAVLGTVNISASQAAANAIILNASNGAGGITATAGTGNFNITSKSLVVNANAVAIDTGILLTQGAATAAVQVGNGVPVHNAPQGSLYLNTSGVAHQRAYINTDGAGTWTLITTAA